MGQIITRIDLLGVNCYLCRTENGFILFDTGGHIIMDKEFTNRREALEKALQEAGCTTENLNLVILTHGDVDHVCNAAYLQEKYHAKIAIHPGDLKLVRNPDIEDLMASFQYRSVVFKLIFKCLQGKIRKIAMKTINAYQAFTPDILIDENFNLEEYGFYGDIIFLPGHTNGSIGILSKEGDLIAGDVLSNVKKPDAAMNALDFSTLYSSIDCLKKYNIKHVYPGHGEPFDYTLLKM